MSVASIITVTWFLSVSLGSKAVPVFCMAVSPWVLHVWLWYGVLGVGSSGYLLQVTGSWPNSTNSLTAGGKYRKFYITV